MQLQNQALNSDHSSSIAFYDFYPQFSSMLSEVLEGLSESPKTLPPKFFYDETGSQLFDEICNLEEYYPTRTEMSILEDYADEISQLCGEDATLIELGSGSSQKIRILLDAMRPLAYLPLDISRDHLISSSHQLAKDYPWLEVHAACVDYSTAWKLPYHSDKGRRIAFFPGSSIGNFTPEDACILLKEVAQLVGKGGNLLIGVDRIKDISTLENAYNDAKGVTAQFNLNLLNRLNQELNCNFNIEDFSHRAFFNKQQNRIEMHLISEKEQTVEISGKRFSFRADETLHTENSYKYSYHSFLELADSAGFKCRQHWCDEKQWFSVFLLEVK